jgi:hypothetical protein
MKGLHNTHESMDKQNEATSSSLSSLEKIHSFQSENNEYMNTKRLIHYYPYLNYDCVQMHSLVSIKLSSFFMVSFQSLAYQNRAENERWISVYFFRRKE